MSRISTGTLARMRDEVDRLVEAWQRERADLDLRPMEVLSRVSRLGHHLDRARRQAFAEHGLESWEFDVLAALRRAGRAVRALPRPAAQGDAGDQRHDDQPGRPARRPRARRAAARPAATGAACWSGSPTPGRRPSTAPWTGCSHRERALLAALDAADQQRSPPAARAAAARARGCRFERRAWRRRPGGRSRRPGALTPGARRPRATPPRGRPSRRSARAARTSSSASRS